MTTLINNHQHEDTHDDTEETTSVREKSTKDLPVWSEIHLECSQTRLDDHITESQQRFDNLLAKMRVEK